jgi:ABC-2 type transport system ATP-binding protein
MTEAVLRLEGLSKSFDRVRAVQDLSAEVRAGEVFGLLGPNGAGKTTTIRMITGELRPDGGRIALHDRPLSPGRMEAFRVGLCPQELVIWEKLTCREQLEFVAAMFGIRGRQARERANRLLSDLGLGDRADRLGGALSGGQKRRLNIALALVHRPELVVLDEPGAGLDPQGRALVREVVRDVAKSSTVVLTTHDMDEADRLCDRVAVVDHGRLLVCDHPADLRRGLGGELIELRFLGGGEDAAADVLHGRPGIDVRCSPGMVSLRTQRAVAVVGGVLDVLRDRGVVPDEVRMRQPSLEDVFLHLTGRKLRS